jgi:virginiamycin B lyase
MDMNRREFMLSTAAVATVAGTMGLGGRSNSARAETVAPLSQTAREYDVTYFDAVPGSRSRDIAFNTDGSVWYCGQRDGTLTRLDPRNGNLDPVPLGDGSAPHGVVLGPDNAFWITDGGQNAIARLDPSDKSISRFPLPTEFARANLNTGVFDRTGIYWFTGQNGVLGRIDPRSEKLNAWAAPGGRGPYGITITPDNNVWYVSLAGNHLGVIDRETFEVTRFDPPTANAGPRRVWSDSNGLLWISEWNSGNVSRFNPSTAEWQNWKLPGEAPRCYSVYVDERHMVWTTDFGANAIVLFDPASERFTSFPSTMPNANVRQMAGRPGEAWGGESGTDRLVRIRFPVST